MEYLSTFDMFQLITGIFVLYIAIKGDGSCYEFPALSKEKQKECNGVIRIVYAICGVLALSEVAFIYYCNRKGIEYGYLYLVFTGLILVMLIGLCLWIKKKSK